jgi:uncharacterized protein YggE
MIRKVLALLGVAAALSLFTLACGTKTTVVTNSSETPGITVSGEGSVFGAPDVAVATLGVQADATTVADARSMAATSMDAMVKVLKDGGVADKDIQTTQFSVDPRYDYTNNKQTLIGFTVNNIATVKIHDINKTGELIDAAVSAGGDLARVQGLQFTIDDPSALQNQARQKAMADAKSRADTLAQAAGVQLGAPRSISEGGGPTPITFSAAGVPAGLDQTRTTPIQTGQLQVQVTVSVIYGLK